MNFSIYLRQTKLWTIATIWAIGILHGQLSTHAGLIYYVDGEVWLDQQRVSKFDPMVCVAAGHTLCTKADTRAELLLQPRNYLRLDADSDVQMKSGVLSAVELDIKGTAMLDVSAIDARSSIVAGCNSASVSFSKSGLYRLDCGPDGAIRVIRGRARISVAGRNVELQAGQIVHLSRTLKVQKQGAGASDKFDQWSTGRAETLTRMEKRGAVTGFGVSQPPVVNVDPRQY